MKNDRRPMTPLSYLTKLRMRLETKLAWFDGGTMLVGLVLLLAVSSNQASVPSCLNPQGAAKAKAKAVVATPKVIWLTAKQARAKAGDKPTLVHLTNSKTCANCLLMDREVFTDKKVVAATERFVCAKVDLSQFTKEQVTTILAFYGMPAKVELPYEVFLLSGEVGWEKENRKRFHVTGSRLPRKPKEYVEYLDKNCAYLNECKGVRK